VSEEFVALARPTEPILPWLTYILRSMDDRSMLLIVLPIFMEGEEDEKRK